MKLLEKRTNMTASPVPSSH